MVIRYNGLESKEKVANAIVVDNLNNVYITGGSVWASEDYDFITIKYTQMSGMKEERLVKREKKSFKEKFYDITGKLIKEKKLKKGIYFKITEIGWKEYLKIRKSYK